MKKLDSQLEEWLDKGEKGTGDPEFDAAVQELKDLGNQSDFMLGGGPN